MGENEKQKEIIILLGSPRKKGNSTVLAKEIEKGAVSAGARVESIYIQGMDINACQACWACQKPGSKGCAIKDDMQELFPKLAAADAWVIATPVHWFTMSTQTKLWMDRCFALAKYGDNPFGKDIGIAISYGDEDPHASGAVNAIRCFQDAFHYVGANIKGIVYGSATHIGEMQQNEKVLKRAEALGKKLAR